MADLPDLVPILTDGVVTLRAHSMGDVSGILEQCQDAESLRWTTVPRHYTGEDAATFVHRAGNAWRDPGGSRYWAVEARDADGRPRFAGTVDLRPGESWDYASIGFGLHPAARGHGAMARAVRLVARHAFDNGPWGRQLSRIHWRAIAGNWGSRRVAWATGFTFHGTLPGTHRNVADPDGPGLDSWHGSLAASDTLEPRHPWFEPVDLEGDGIRLRAWRDEDVDAIEPRTDDPHHWMPAQGVLRTATFPEWLARKRLLMADGQSIEWCVADVQTDAALGGVAVFSRQGPMTGDVAELGYQFNPSARGRGLAKEAARLAVTHAVTPKAQGGLGLRRLVAQTAADNVASNKVLESAGFVVFGREHEVDALLSGRHCDGLHWERLTTPRHATPGSEAQSTG